MSIFKKKIPGFTLLEMLIVLSIIIILGAIGTGGLLEFRETMLIKENIEIIKQDVILAQQKAMLLEKKAGENWIFGIGIDFRNISNGEYTMFKWCSPYSDFEDGGEVTRSSLLAKVPESNVGGNATDEDGNLYIYNACFPSNYAPYYCPGNTCDGNNVCLLKIEGSSAKKLHDVGTSSVLTSPFTSPFTTVSFVVFEAVTGKAFLYKEQDDAYCPINYNLDGTYKAPELRVPLDILITRNRNPRFDLLSIYDSSGIMVHHVYNSDGDAILAPTPPTASQHIFVDGYYYNRFTVADDIKSYRDYE